MYDVQTEVDFLRQQSDKYYTDGSSDITDKEFDERLEKLRQNDPDNPFLEEVGAEDIDSSEWEKHKHEYPLGSLAKVQSIDELKKWWKAQELVIQPKFDGISIALTYEGGKLIRAVTRGKNGVGDDITRNVLKMKGVPHFLNFGNSLVESDQKIVVRGEILITYEDYDAIPDYIKVDGKEVVNPRKGKNPRNHTAGAAKKRTDPLVDNLTVIVYDIMNPYDLGLAYETESIDKLKDLGFPYVSECKIKIIDIMGLEMAVEKMEAKRDSFGYDIDGLVIKSNRIDAKDDWKKPKSKVAYKFDHQEVDTIFQGVAVSVSGERVQPVAILEPVDVGGVTVSKASLHNWPWLREKNLSIGAKVRVSRRNDVIPQVEEVLEAGDGGPVEEPTECPVCGGKLSYKKNTDGSDSPYLICTNPDCDAKIEKHVMKWLRIHETKGVAESTVKVLYDNGIIESLEDFLGIIDGNSDEKILALPKMGKSKLDTIKKCIKQTLTTNPIKFFAGMNLNGFGRGRFDKIVNYVHETKEDADYTDVMMVILSPYSTGLSNVEGFARPSAQSLKDTIAINDERIKAVYALVTIEPLKKQAPVVGSCSGKSFCFTGALEIVRREAEKYVKANGGKIASVSKNLDYLVTDDPIDPNGSNKMQKAIKLGIKIITGDEFNKMVMDP